MFKKVLRRVAIGLAVIIVVLAGVQLYLLRGTLQGHHPHQLIGKVFRHAHPPDPRLGWKHVDLYEIN